MKLEHKVALVTGTSKGIGKAVTLDLLNAGVKVFGLSRSKGDLSHPNFHWIETNLKDESAINKAVTDIRKTDNISILINNAGYGFVGSVEETSVKDWEDVFKVNVHAPFILSKLLVPDMKNSGEGHIINISSIAGQGGIANMTHYCATKFAVKGFSQSLYKEVRDYGVKVSCIYPGSVNTNFFDDIDAVQTHDNMMKAQDISSSIMYALQTNANYHIVDLEVRPLMPKGKKELK